MIVIVQSCCFRAKVVVFGKKRLYSGKSGCIRAKLVVGWLFWGKNYFIRITIIVFVQSGRFRLNVVVFLQSGCIRAKVVVFG